MGTRLSLSAAGLATAASLALACPATAAPVMCTDHGANPQGITATHLLAKVGDAWVEPPSVCVGAQVEEKPGADGQITRGLYLGVWNTVDGGFPETHLPPGTEISLGLHLPDGMVLGNTFGRWLDGVVITQGADTVIQGKTVEWDYHNEAYFGGPGLDCNLAPTVWPSTFTAYSSLNPLHADRTPDLTPTPFTGAFYESNTVGALFPKIVLDSDGTPTGLEAEVSGCGDHDPSTYEGYFNGFTPISVLRSYGMTDEMVGDLDLLQNVLEVYDLTSQSSVSAAFKPVHAGDLTLEQIPGVAMPAPPPGDGLIGVRTDSQFSYSSHDLLQRGRAGAMASMRECRSQGGTPAAANGNLTCTGVTPTTSGLHATLFAPRVLKRGATIGITCTNVCRARAGLVFAGRRVASAASRSPTAARQRLRLRLTAAGRRLFAGKRTLHGTLTVVVTDATGEQVVLHRTFR